MRDSFHQQLKAGWNQDKLICVGLDPDPNRLPPHLTGNDVERVIAFNKEVIEATADLALVYKPQSAYYESLGLGGPAALKATIELIREIAPAVPVILDAKRGDIGSSNEAYVRTVFDYYEADAVTVSPYLGPEAMAPFLERADRGVIVLCRTSNPGAAHYQNLEVLGRKLYEVIAQDVADNWNYNNNCSLVVGATAPAELADIRRIVPQLPFLVPGIGAQGGDVKATLDAGLDANKHGLMLSSSRGLIYAYEKSAGDSIRQATRTAALALSAEIDAAR